MGGVDAAAGVDAGGGAEVQNHVVIRRRSGEAVEVVVLVQAQVGVVVAEGGVGLVVETGGSHTSNTHPQHRVQAQVMAGVDLGQEAGSQVFGQRRQVGVQYYVVQLFGQQFAMQIDVGAVPAVAGLERSKRVPVL